MVALLVPESEESARALEEKRFGRGVSAVLVGRDASRISDSIERAVAQRQERYPPRLRVRCSADVAPVQLVGRGGLSRRSR